MRGDRRSRGFEPLGSIGADALKLSASRVKDLELQAAWRKVAGAVLTQHAQVAGLRRGVLELHVADAGWRRAIERLLPELGARFSREHPALGVTRFKFVDRPAAPAAQ
jgi:hypothetical protein